MTAPYDPEDQDDTSWRGEQHPDTADDDAPEWREPPPEEAGEYPLYRRNRDKDERPDDGA